MDVLSSAKNFDEYTGTDEDITVEADQLTQENFILAQTAEVLERYLRKRSPMLLVTMDRFMESATLSRSSSMQTQGRCLSDGSSRSSPGGTGARSSTTSSVAKGTGSRSRGHSSMALKLISPALKADLTEKEIEESRMTMEKLRRRFESAKFLLETEEENLKLDLENLKQSKREFEDFLVQNTVGKSGKVSYDKLFRFLKHGLSTDDRHFRNIKLKSKSLLNEYKRIMTQQQHRIELRERLHPVDIEKLMIENQEQLDVLELKNENLEDLKKVIGRKGQTIVSFKSKLGDAVCSLANVKNDLKQKQIKFKYTTDQEERTTNLLAIAENNYYDIKRLTEAYKTTDVYSYLEIQSKLEELKLEKITWQRRCKYQKQQIALLEHQLKQLSPPSRGRSGSMWKGRNTLYSIIPFRGSIMPFRGSIMPFRGSVFTKDSD